MPALALPSSKLCAAAEAPSPGRTTFSGRCPAGVLAGPGDIHPWRAQPAWRHSGDKPAELLPTPAEEQGPIRPALRMHQRQAAPRALGNVPSAPACKGEASGGNEGTPRAQLSPSAEPWGPTCSGRRAAAAASHLGHKCWLREERRPSLPFFPKLTCRAATSPSIASRERRRPLLGISLQEPGCT